AEPMDDDTILRGYLYARNIGPATLGAATLAEQIEWARATCQMDIRAALSLLTKLSSEVDRIFGGAIDAESPAAQFAHLTRVVTSLGEHLTGLDGLRGDGWRRLDEIHGVSRPAIAAPTLLEGE
ncbi:MAG: hypothetical protein ACRCW4_05790, partial [Candidatus Neomicrothrix subdominans]